MELFISIEKTGSQDRWFLDSIARLASLALQHGIPMADICDQWVETKGRPCGMVQGDQFIKMCSSPLDYVAKHLLTHYGGREDLKHVKVATYSADGRGVFPPAGPQ